MTPPHHLGSQLALFPTPFLALFRADILTHSVVYWCQFHQHFARAFCAKKLQSQKVTREKLGKALSHEKLVHKRLMKLFFRNSLLRITIKSVMVKTKFDSKAI